MSVAPSSSKTWTLDEVGGGPLEQPGGVVSSGSAEPFEHLGFVRRRFSGFF